MDFKQLRQENQQNRVDIILNPYFRSRKITMEIITTEDCENFLHPLWLYFTIFYAVKTVQNLSGI